MSQKILGAWHERKLVTFLPDGTWKLQRYKGAPVEPGNFTWSIHNGKLILAREGKTFPGTIKSITATKFILQSDGGGNPSIYTREESAPASTEQTKSTSPDSVAAEQELNSVYTSLRKTLNPEAKKKLKTEQQIWLKQRSALKPNSDQFITFTTERTAALKTQLAASKP